MNIDVRHAVIQKVTEDLLSAYNIHLYIKREDLLHPYINGNKWRKLKHNLLEAKKLNKNTLLTFGGAYSNHIYATAAAARQFGFKSIGIIRGEAYEPLNPTLKFANDQGMYLHYINRELYRQKDDSSFLQYLQQLFHDFYLIPEGGANKLGMKGCQEILTALDSTYDYICCACGTGVTLAGLIKSAPGEAQLLGFSVLKNGAFLANQVRGYLSGMSHEKNNWKIITDYHFGGYAKFDATLIDFINRFSTTHSIPLEPVYTGKMLFGIYDLIKKGFFEKHARILLIHTGGLQGIYGINQRFGNIIFSL